MKNHNLKPLSPSEISAAPAWLSPSLWAEFGHLGPLGRGGWEKERWCRRVAKDHSLAVKDVAAVVIEVERARVKKVKRLARLMRGIR